ncbi:MAG TPA: heat-inducible transcriptional repressor HrcA [Candidatus Sulfotelmatobacter sp.]|nr:heat-inducible transcriptional repressor HrcA [Candidatus Sulfotelmatobacter sp.]
MLNARHRDVLRSVVTDYIRTAEPVGSRTISRKYGFSLSPATIRTIMADLEELGYLSQPHTSAGRVPTDRGYRLYVDTLMEPSALSPAEMERIERLVGPMTGETGELLRAVGKLLSALSPYVAVAMARRIHETRFRRVEFVSLAADRILVVLLAESGLVHHKTVLVDEPISQEQLDRIARYLTELLQKHTLKAAREQLLTEMAEEKAQYDRLLAQAIRVGTKALDGGEGEADIYVTGVARIADQPEFAEVSRMKALFAAFEEKSKLVMILNECLTGEESKIFIGSELPVQDIGELSVIASPYRQADEILGVLGMVGPTRMDYGRTQALVQTTAHLLSRILTGRVA